MSVITLEELREKLTRWSVVAPQACKKALTEGAETVRREVQEKHFRLPKMPRGVGGTTDAWLGSSEPRHPFHLRKSIAIEVEVKPGEVHAYVGTNVFYGRLHELGIGKMPERPFLRPSLAAKREDVFQKLRVRLFESYNTGAA